MFNMKRNLESHITLLCNKVEGEKGQPPPNPSQEEIDLWEHHKMYPKQVVASTLRAFNKIWGTDHRAAYHNPRPTRPIGYNRNISTQGQYLHTVVLLTPEEEKEVDPE